MKDKKIIIQAELERRILHGLACEWETALWVLPAPHMKAMRKPLFSLRVMKGKWGYWSPEKREICLSQHLVHAHPWYCVREVLLHETAHQFAQEVLGAQNDPPHGPTFQRACYMLRANPKASGSHVLPDKRMCHNTAMGHGDKTLTRVKKLMALAQSKNRHEAKAAMAKAHAFISKYNLDILARDQARDFMSIFIGSPALRHFREDYYLARLLQDYYFVSGLWVPAYVLDKGRMGRVLEITGTTQNIQLASYVYDFMRHFISSQWHIYNKDKGLNRYRKTDFAVGIIEGFGSTLKKQTHMKNMPAGKHGLIPIKDPMLQHHMAYKYPRTTRFTRSVSSQDPGVLKDGIRAGRKLVISKGIAETGKGKRLLIQNG